MTFSSEAVGNEMRETSSLSAMRVLYRILTRRRKIQLLLTLALMFFSGLAEVVSISAVFPFLALMADPDAIARHENLARLVQFLRLDRSDDLLPIVAGGLIVLAVVAGVVRLLLAWVSNKVVLRIGHDLGLQLYARILAQPYAAHLQRNSSEVLAGVEKIHTAIFSLLLPMMQGLSSLVIAGFIIALLALINPVALLIAAAGIGVIYGGVVYATRRMLFRQSKIAADAQTLRIQQVQESIGGIRDIIIDRAQPLFVDSFRRVDSEFRNAQAVIVFVGAAPRFVIEAAGIIVIALLAMHMVQQPGGMLSALPVLGSLALGAQRLLPLFQQVYLSWSSYAGGRAALFDLVGLLQSRVDQTRMLPAGHDVPTFSHQIELRNVSFGYDQEPVLRDINLVISRGDKVGFIGETGSGKSTLLDILMGLLEPTSGELLVDGVVIDDSSRANWQRQIAHVPQAIYLSDNSVSGNIAFGRNADEIDPARVRESAQSAQISDVIEAMPYGYDTSVGERGLRLSGGQRQRIGIARALYKRSTVLVMDEATSALDPETEARVMQGIDLTDSSPTVLMVAHRLSTLSGCNRIVRLERGAVSWIGPYSDLETAHPRAKRSASSQ